MKSQQWSLSKILVEGLEPEKREPRPRDVIWASEIGKPHFDRYYKMKGKEGESTIDSRTMFKFFIGDALEYAIAEIFRRCGMTVEVQKGGEKLRIETEGNLPVEGKYDAIIGASGEWDKAIFEIENFPLPEEQSFIDRYALLLAKYLKEKYPNGFNRELFEIKTINSMALSAGIKYDTLEETYFHYHLQLYTYMKAKNVDVGNILYISKDAGTFHIVRVEKTEELEQAWQEDVRKMTEYYNSSEPPKFPDLISFNGRRYKPNWYAIGSDFLHLHTDEDRDTLIKETKREVARLNRELRKKEKNEQ